jgi:GTP-binding protein
MAIRPIVARVGRPNVGKSALFNRIVKSRLSIVEGQPGVTRDRIYADTEWQGTHFVIVDTGGITLNEDDPINEKVRQQAEIAVEQSSVIIFVLDTKTGLLPEDEDVARIIRSSRKPCVLCINKVDDPRHMDYSFWSLGLGEPLPVTAAHGTGVAEMLDAVVALIKENIPQKDAEEGEGEQPIKVAFVGRPNVGKSSIVNRYIGYERTIVSDIPGTTRDAIDTPLIIGGKDFVFIDTAGIRRKPKISTSVEFYSVVRSMSAIERSDVSVIVLDGTQDIAEQDVRVAGFAHEAGKAIVVAVNKWDALEREEGYYEKMIKNIKDKLAFMEYAKIIFVSAKLGRHMDKLIEAIEGAYQANRRRITTSEINKLLEEAVMRFPPPGEKGRQPKLFYMSQVRVQPPTFVLFTSNPELVHFSYQRYLENLIREAYDFAGTPILLHLRKRS